MPKLDARWRGRSVGVGAMSLAIAACGATTGGPPATASDLSCLTTLATHCCELESRGEACVPDFGAAHACASWPAANPIAIYAAPCHGYVAVRVPVASYTSIYVYDATTSALLAIGDNAALADGSSELACGAGPTGFRIPGDCSAAWLVAAGASACDPNGATSRAEWCSALDAGAE